MLSIICIIDLSFILFNIETLITINNIKKSNKISK